MRHGGFSAALVSAVRATIMVAATAALLAIGGAGVALAADSSASASADSGYPFAKATDAEKKIYEGLKRQVSGFNALDVSTRANNPGFADKVGSELCPLLETSLWGYRYSGDTSWLDRFVTLMDAIEKQLIKDPDGCLGLYGSFDTRRFAQPWPPNWPPELLTLFQGAEARLGTACLDFALTARNDPGLTGEKAETFRAKADHWTELFEKELMAKWQKCGNYHEFPDDRGVFTWPDQAFRVAGKKVAASQAPVSRDRGASGRRPAPAKTAASAENKSGDGSGSSANSDSSTAASGESSPPADEGGWTKFFGMVAAKNLTLPHPYLSEIARYYLKHWQLTGNAESLNLAAKVLRFQKSYLRPGQNDSYWWNYWDPADDTDFRPEGGLAFGMFMSTDPVYHTRDVEAFIEAYHCGTIIDATDIRRLVNTQLKAMLRGEASKPSWLSPKGDGGRGLMWSPLAEFDEELQKVVELNLSVLQLEFGSPLRYLTERALWTAGVQEGQKREPKPRKLTTAGSAGLSAEAAGQGATTPGSWPKNYKDFKKEYEDLVRRHPPPDPAKRGQRAPTTQQTE